MWILSVKWVLSTGEVRRTRAVPEVFRQAECNGFGSDIFNAKYWDDQAGFKEFPVLDVLNKWLATVQ